MERETKTLVDHMDLARERERDNMTKSWATVMGLYEIRDMVADRTHCNRAKMVLDCKKE